MTEIKRNNFDPNSNNVRDCLAHAIHWFDQLTKQDAERYQAALDTDDGEGSVFSLLLLAARWHLAWIEAEKAGPDYGSQTRDTHPDGERIWSEWWEGQLRLCERTEAACRKAIAAIDNA